MSYLDCPRCGCTYEQEWDCRKKDCVCHKKPRTNSAEREERDYMERKQVEKELNERDTARRDPSR